MDIGIRTEVYTCSGRVTDKGSGLCDIWKDRNISTKGGATMAGLTKKELESIIGHSVELDDGYGEE